MTEDTGADAGAAGEQTPAPAPPPPRRRSRRRRAAIWCVVILCLLIGAMGFATLALTGKPLPMPVWMVAEAEARLNRSFAGTRLEGAVVSLGAMELTVGQDFVPRVRLENVRLVQPGGATLALLPETRIAFDPGALAGFALRPRSVVVVGARLAARRLRDGTFDLAFGGGDLNIESYAALTAAVEAVFAAPVLSSLRRVEAEALTLTVEDQRAGRVWQVGDGRLTVQNRADERAFELSMTLLDSRAVGALPVLPIASDGTTMARLPARAIVTFVTEKGSPAARINATMENVAAPDIAAQAAPMAFLGVLDAPISGRLSAALDGAGALTTLEASLDIAAGALRPTPETKPIAFERAGLGFAYDPVAERISLTQLSVDSASLRLTATGHAYLPGAAEGLPQVALTQIRFSEVMVDPEGLFTEPVRFSEGALDLRLRLDPFSIDIGQLALVEGGRRLIASGRVAAEPKGWRLAVDVALDEITHDRLLALWPLALVPRTREWLVENVQEGQLFDVKAAVRAEPGRDTRLTLGYEFESVDVRFLKSLPPIEQGHGHATLEDTRYTLVLDRGRVTPPLGGPIDVAGSVFAVPDITLRPSRAELTLKSDSSLTAALSLLDEPPFRFLTKAGQPVTLGKGRAVLETRMSLPLAQRVELADVDYDVAGRILDLRSDVLVPGRLLTAPDLALAADPEGLRLSGAGLLGTAPFDVTYRQPFARGAPARIEGLMTLSQVTLDEFRIALPPGTVSGQGVGQVTVDLAKGVPPRLTLVSDLNRIGLTLPALGWTKPAATPGRLEVEAVLSTPAVVERVELEGAGLNATGRVTLRDDGTLDAATFDRVRLNGWFDGGVTLTGQGAERTPAIAVTGGSVDLRRMDLGSGSGGGGAGTAFGVALDELRVSDTIALTRFRGDFTTDGGLSGDFTGRVNGEAPIGGRAAPRENGTAVRIRSEDAGSVLSSAGIFPNARGGVLDLTLRPTPTPGHYDGQANITDVQIRNVPVLAELLSAISVVGILEQLQGSGLVFSEASARFRLTPDAVEITEGAAVGASLGVSLAGIYRTEGGLLDMQGVVSPVYLLNGIGAFLTRRGEGVFGFNFRLGGTAANPEVSVNPLSILTPGMFRDIFRRAAPTLEDQ